MSHSVPIVIPDEAMDTLAYQVEKIRRLYAVVEDLTTEHVWKREEGMEHLHPEIEKEIGETLESLDNMDRVMRQHITRILDGTVTVATTTASAEAAGVADDIVTQPLPPSSPRAIAKAKTASAPAPVPTSAPIIPKYSITTTPAPVPVKSSRLGATKITTK